MTDLIIPMINVIAIKTYTMLHLQR